MHGPEGKKRSFPHASPHRTLSTVWVQEHQLDGDGPSTHLLDHPGASVSEVPSALPWLEESGGSALAPCVPDENLKLEWIHGYSAQVSGVQRALLRCTNHDFTGG